MYGNVLRAVDRLAHLNGEVQYLERDCDVMWGGKRYRFQVILTGDGKLMMMSNPGHKCWWCPNLDSMEPSTSSKVLCRWGAFLTCLRPCRRIGDYNHCACGVGNAVIQRVRWLVEQWVEAGRLKSRAIKEL